MKTLTEDQIIANHHPAARDRARIELQIVNSIIDTAARRGCTLTVLGCDEDLGTYDVRTALFDLDDAVLKITKDGGATLGYAYLVFGNGPDLISDYSEDAEDFLGEALATSESLAS